MIQTGDLIIRDLGFFDAAVLKLINTTGAFFLSRLPSCVLDGNLQTLYHVNRPSSDTYLRERLDELDPNFIRPAFKKIFAELQRGKCLEEFEFLEGYYLLSLDGTGEFFSSKVCCEQCCKKEHKDGSVTYYHQMLGACIVQPEPWPWFLHGLEYRYQQRCYRSLLCTRCHLDFSSQFVWCPLFLFESH